MEIRKECIKKQSSKNFPNIFGEKSLKVKVWGKAKHFPVRILVRLFSSFDKLTTELQQEFDSLSDSIDLL